MSKNPAPIPTGYRMLAIGLLVLFIAWMVMIWW
jgi:hypothetical protein